MPIFNGFILICFSVFLIFIAGLYNFLINHDNNGCTMTYMFEYPQFVKIALPLDVIKQYRPYALYAYGEGRYIEKVRDMKFTGIPVLFIPGHRGSYQQVRSLASVSLRKAVGSRSPFHLDYFSVDLNEDYSGLYGGHLETETKFVQVAINRILSLYRRPDPPTSVVIIGHSMGGVIGKLLSKASIIITLATPHKPAVILDQLSWDFYRQVDAEWRLGNYLQNATLVSVGGGSRDMVVHSSLTFSPHAHINVVTEQIPGVWLPVDHLCILWCKELVFVLVRALFDCIDPVTHQVHTDPVYRKKVFSYHLLQRSGEKYLRDEEKQVVLWKGEGDKTTWLRLKKNQLTWSKLDVVSVTTNIIVPLFGHTYDTLLVHTINHKTSDWLFSCKADTNLNTMKICSIGDNISSKARISPTKDFKRRTVVLDLTELRSEGKTHVVIRTLPSNEHVKIWFDMFKKDSRTLSAGVNYLKGSDLVKKTELGEVYHLIQLADLFKPWNAYELIVKSFNCSSLQMGQVSVNVPWNNEGSSFVLTEEHKRIPIRTYSPKPSRDSKSVFVEVYLNPDCVFNIRMEKSIVRSLGELVGVHYTNVVSFVAVCLLMTLARQVRLMKEQSECPLLQSVIVYSAKPYYILPSVNIVAAIARYLHTMFPFLPVSDVHHQSGFSETLFIPLLLHCSAVTITFILATCILLGVAFQGQAFNSLILRFLNKLCLGLPWLSGYVLSGIKKVPVIVSALMFATAYSACSALAIHIGLIFYFFKLVSFYEDFWEEIVYWPLRVLKAMIWNKMNRQGKMTRPELCLDLSTIKNISFHLTLFMMWGLVALITAPSLIAWARNYRYNTYLEKDPFFTTAMLLSFCGVFLWQADLPKYQLKLSHHFSRVLLAMCVIVLVYCRSSLHRLQLLVTSCLTLVCVHQIFAPSLEQPPQLIDPLTSVLEFFPYSSYLVQAAQMLFSQTTQTDKSSSGSSQEPFTTKPDKETENTQDLELSSSDSSLDGENAELTGSIQTSSCIGEASVFNDDRSPSSDISVSSYENISLTDVKE